MKVSVYGTVRWETTIFQSSIYAGSSPNKSRRGRSNVCNLYLTGEAADDTTVETGDIQVKHRCSHENHLPAEMDPSSIVSTFWPCNGFLMHSAVVWTSSRWEGKL